jgi:hypothetical protein
MQLAAITSVPALPPTVPRHLTTPGLSPSLRIIHFELVQNKIFKSMHNRKCTFAVASDSDATG